MNRVGELIEEMLLYRRELKVLLSDHAKGNINNMQFFVELNKLASKQLSIDKELQEGNLL